MSFNLILDVESDVDNVVISVDRLLQIEPTQDVLNINFTTTN